MTFSLANMPFALVQGTLQLDPSGLPAQLFFEQSNALFKQYFPDFASLEKGQALAELPVLDYLKQLRGEMSPQSFLQKGDHFYKVESVRSGTEWSLFLVEISTEIHIHSQIVATHIEYSTLDSDEQFLRILQTSEDSMLLLENGVFVECNDAVTRFLGYKNKEEFLMQPPKALSPMYQQGGITSEEKAKQMTTEAIRKGYHRFEWTHLRSDGSPVLVEVSLTSVVYQGRPMLHCIWRDLTEQKRIEQELKDQQDRLLLAMSAPITQLWEQVLLLPLVGGVDAQRANKILQTSLQKIAGTQSKVFIIDINGIDTVDSYTAQSLIKLAKATQLMGCTAILSGISPTIAQMIVELQLDISTLNTFTNLQDALQKALQLIGVR